MRGRSRMNIKNLLTISQNLPPLDSELLLSFVLHQLREFVITHPEFEITKKQETKYKTLIKKRASGIPLAYLTGHKEFFGLYFLVDKSTLIPRPDTEILVEGVIENIKDQRLKIKDQRIVLIDVGTGTGCIPISILKYQSIQIPTLAIDKSKKALITARKNAKKHNVKIKFLQGNLLAPFLKSCLMIHFPCSIIITANLPYLTNQQYLSNPDLKHEPKTALVAKNHGLFYYEQLLKQINDLRSSILGLQLTLFFEIDPSQSNQIKKLITHYLPQSKIEIKKDLAGRDRVVVIN